MLSVLPASGGGGDCCLEENEERKRLYGGEELGLYFRIVPPELKAVLNSLPQ